MYCKFLDEMYKKVLREVGVKFHNVFLSTEWFLRNSSYFALVLPLDFPEILIFLKISMPIFCFKISRKSLKNFKPFKTKHEVILKETIANGCLQHGYQAKVCRSIIGFRTLMKSHPEMD